MAEILRALFRNAAENGSRPAFTDDAGSVTWAELASRVSAFSEELHKAPPILGLYGHNDIDWVIALLAGWLAGRTLVPLPTFFSAAQLRHVLEDAGAGEVVCSDSGDMISDSLERPIRAVSRRRGKRCHEPVGGGGLIIYTSGSTGAPKGVRLSLSQIDWQAMALARLTDANSQDLHLSVLPLSLLLEIICAVGIPTIAGARTHLATQTARAVGEGSVRSFNAAFERKATTSVLVPQLLSVWIAELEASGQRASEELRFVALGGAPVSEGLSQRAWQKGIPVYEGYGLSECCSVVAVNPPHCRKPGTVGVPLPGLDVRIDNGEIVVSGPTVMKGYLNGPDVGGSWHTGDLGHLDDDGYLTVAGRKDNLLVTSFGRNINPEWIEAMLMSDARIGTCAVFGHGEPRPRVLLIPSAAGEEWLARTPRPHVLLWIERMCAAAPPYAVPRDFASCPAADARKRGLQNGNGQVVRAAVPGVYDALTREHMSDPP